MDLSIPVIGLAMICGIVAGFINTLAGSGSLITLPMFIFMGLPANVANGTNRIGIILQNIVGLTKFRQAGQLDVERGRWFLLPTVIGAIIGSKIAVDLNEKMMHQAIGIIMVVMLGVILLKPKSWLKTQSELMDRRDPLTFLIFVGIGIYGGFVQAGVGIFLLAGLVLRCGLSMVEANSIKLLLVLVFTVPALIVFQLNDQIHWPMGLLMAVGQGIGAWLAAHFASNNQNATLWMRRLLICVILVSIFKMFGIFTWLSESFLN